MLILSNYTLNICWSTYFGVELPKSNAFVNLKGTMIFVIVKYKLTF